LRTFRTQPCLSELFSRFHEYLHPAAKVSFGYQRNSSHGMVLLFLLSMVSFAPESNDYGCFFQAFETIFDRTRAPIDWERYASAIAQRRRPDFRGPDFLSISPARSATTWLFRQLGRNYSIYLPEVKETNFFVSGWLDGPYERFFEDWRPYQLAGDISPTYAILPRRAVREIHQAYPETRLICILRNPIERVWSQVLFDLLRKEGWLRMTHREVSSLPEQVILTLVAFHSWWNRYDAILEQWLEFYPAGQFHIDFFESVATSPDAYLHRICRFLEVPNSSEAVPGAINALQYGGLKMPPRVDAFLRSVFVPQLNNLDRILRQHFSFGIPESWNWSTMTEPGPFKVVEDYRGWDVYYSGELYRAVPHGEPERAEGKVSPQLFEVLPIGQGTRDSILESLMALLCENRQEPDAPVLLTSYRDHNLVEFQGHVYALPHSLGVWDKWQTEDPASVPGVLKGSSMREVLAMLET